MSSFDQELRQDEGGEQISVEQSLNKNNANTEVEMAKVDGEDKQKEEDQVHRVELPILEIDEIEIQQAKDAVAYKKQKNRNQQSIIAIEEKVNYLELMAYIQSTHPTVEVPVDNDGGPDEEPENPYRYFLLCEKLGNLAPSLPCKRHDENKGAIEITPMSQQLGLGPSLFLMSTKAFAWFFLALSIINLPVMIFYGTGNSAGAYERPTDLFAILSMGNVGQSGQACDAVPVQDLFQKNPVALGYNAKEQWKEYDRSSKLQLNCGIGSKIKSLIQIGLTHNKTSSCKGIYDKPAEYASSFKDDCYYHNSSSNTLFEYKSLKDTRADIGAAWGTENYESYLKPERKMLENEMECLKNVTEEPLDFANFWFQCHCVGKSTCKMPALMSASQSKYTYEWNSETSTKSDVETGKFVAFPQLNWIGIQMKDACFENLKKEAPNKEEKPQVMALASCVSPKIENPFTGNEWDKDSLGVLIVFFDIASVIALILFAKALIATQEDYVEAFDLATIQMTDFTVRVQNLPHHLLYGNSDDHLRAMLTAHFQQILKDEMQLKKQEAHLMGSADDDFDNLTAIDPTKGNDKLEALDYEIADINFGKADMTDMNYLVQLSDLQNVQTRNQIRKSMLAGRSSACCGDDPITKIDKQEYKLNYEFERIRDAYLEEIKRDKKIDFTEEEKEKELETDPEVRYAYVTFRSMDAVDLVKSSYKRYGACQRFCIMKCAPQSCCKDARTDLKKKYICKQYPSISNAVTPDSINWENLGYGNTYRTCMAFCNWILAIGMIVLSLILIIILKQYTISLKKEYNTSIVCPSESGTEEFKLTAWNDQQLPQKDRLGLMHCYCMSKLMSDGTEVRKEKFEEFQKEDEISGKMEADKTPYCSDWLINYGSQQASVIFTSLIVVVINIVASIVLTLSVTVEKNHTVNDETMGQFMKLTILQFINIGVIVLIINFDFTDTNEDGTKALWLGFLPIFNGTYKDFNSEWYSQIGKTLCLTLLLNIFTPHISKLTIPFLKQFKRCCDRGCSSRIWKKKKSPADIDVNTKLVLQSDVNALYTGDQIQSHYIYAQNYTYLCVVLMYSTGLPILYPFAALFYCVLYWVYKGLLLKYYARTTKFNEEIPIQSMSWVKFGILIHLFIGSIMLSNHNFFPKTSGDKLINTDSYTDVVAVDKYKGIMDDGLGKGEDFAGEYGVQYSSFFISAYFERLESGSQSTIYLTFIVLMFVIWLVANLLGILFNFFSCLRGPILRIIACCCKVKLKEVKSKDIYKEFDVLSLESMLTKARDDLGDFNQSAEKLEKGASVAFMENRHSEEINYVVSNIQEIYERRIKQIELVCDDHIVHLHGEDNLNQHFKHLLVDEKLRYLLDKQQLIHKDKRMRLVDITQSFNIYDSIAFKKAKGVQEKIESNEQFNLSSKVTPAEAAETQNQMQ